MNLKKGSTTALEMLVIVGIIFMMIGFVMLANAIEAHAQDVPASSIGTAPSVSDPIDVTHSATPELVDDDAQEPPPLEHHSSHGGYHKKATTTAQTLTEDEYYHIWLILDLIQQWIDIYRANFVHA